MPDTYGNHVNDFLILPGQWRSQCPWEHIAWISPPWPSTYYLWLDCPETIFCAEGNFYLSHINQDYSMAYSNLPRVPWETAGEGLFCKRAFENGISFEIHLNKVDQRQVSIRFDIHNGSGSPLHKLRTQTCSYLRGLMEFSDCTKTNKFICQRGGQWHSLEGRSKWEDFRQGDLSLPVIVTCSSEAQRLVAMTWFEHTGSIWSNPHHPCMHADPSFGDLECGERKSIEGALIFFEGSKEDFGSWFRTRNPQFEKAV